nr:hypothetical protein BaRGS_000459 [Batillaria attramentaria]
MAAELAKEVQEEKIQLMLDLLPIRTTQVYDKFADALHVSGHTLIADFLREEDISKHPLDVKDLFKRLPFLSRNMKDVEKKQIESYMAEKIEAAILVNTWQRDTKEKDKALTAKQEQLEQAYQHEQELHKKQEQVNEAERIAREAREESLALRAELKALQGTMARLEQQYKGKIDTQMKFSLANDNIAQRTEQRLAVAEQTLKAVQEKLNCVVKLSPRDKDKDEMKRAENPYAFLPEDVDLFIAQFKKLLVVQLKYEELLEERNWIMSHIGAAAEDGKDDSSLLAAYKEFASKNDERIQGLKQELAQYGDMLEEHKTKLEDISKEKEVEDKRFATGAAVWQGAILSVMRKQLQDIKTALRKKETTIGMKEEEIGKLRIKIAELETAVAEKTQQVESLQSAVASNNNNNPRDLVNGNGASSADSAETATPGATNYNLVSPKVRGNPLPPLKSAATHWPSASKPAVVRPRMAASVPRGAVVESDVPLTMYPAGLTTMQIRVHRDDKQAPGQGQAGLGAVPDPRGRSSHMGSSLGDLKAMHAHTKHPVSRGGQGLGLDANHLGVSTGKHGPSPTPKRKFPARVK